MENKSYLQRLLVPQEGRQLLYCNKSSHLRSTVEMILVQLNWYCLYYVFSFSALFDINTLRYFSTKNKFFDLVNLILSMPRKVVKRLIFLMRLTFGVVIFLLNPVEADDFYRCPSTQSLHEPFDPTMNSNLKFCRQIDIRVKPVIQ